MRENGGKRPRLFDAAYLLTRYRSEFGMAEIPAPVQRVVFPVVRRRRPAVRAPAPVRGRAGAREPKP